MTEIEMYQAALSKIKMNEAAIPLHNGKIVKESDTYDKVEKLLACPEMEQSHKFLYDVDFDELDDETIRKVDDLYDLAIKQGLLQNENEEELDATSDVTEDPSGVSSTGEVAEVVPSVQQVINCYTCFYSAIKNGEIKTGEAYSNAPTPEQAKVDVISKLSKIGFTDINIIAVETGDTDLANCDPMAHTVEKSEPVPSVTAPVEETITEDLENVNEAEICPRCHRNTLVADPHSGNMRCTNCNYWQKTGGLDKQLFIYRSKNESEENTDEKSVEEPEEKKLSTKELSHQEKVELFTKYFKTFKDLLIKMKQTSYKNFDIEGKAEFWKKLSEIWTEKYDPLEFLSPANREKLENMEVKIK